MDISEKDYDAHVGTKKHTKQLENKYAVYVSMKLLGKNKMCVLFLLILSHLNLFFCSLYSADHLFHRYFYVAHIG